MLRKVPLIVILGSTGTGKTKLSLELAERYGGEILSADSMQVYANLDIATAKATKEEQSRAKHHLLDVATPTEPFTVFQFRNTALPIIERLLAQAKCPIVVGGTNYYIESLLWDTLIGLTETPATPDRKLPAATPSSLSSSSLSSLSSSSSGGVSTAAGRCEAAASGNSRNEWFVPAAEMLVMSSELLHGHLGRIDPATANRIHPNNKRKIMRAIEVFQETGQTLSWKLQQQRSQPGANRLGGPLRYPHTILFWLRCNQDVLNARLDKRVDGMLEQGLLREIRAFHNEHKCDQSADNSYTRGVLQTIGFKEFIPYLEQFNAANDLKIEEYLRLNAYKMPTEAHFKANKRGAQHGPAISDAASANASASATATKEGSIDDPSAGERLPAGLELLYACLNELKLVTRRYSKKQMKWINNRFLASKDRQVPPLYELDTSDVCRWQAAVYERAVAIVDCYRGGQVCDVEPMAKRQHPGAELNEETSNYCHICQRHFIGEFQWQLHLKSNKHKRRRESHKKAALKKLDAAEPNTKSDTKTDTKPDA